MKFPLYLYYEILIRIAEIRPDLGEYVSVIVAESSVMVNTDRGVLEVPTELLFRQFNNPDTVSASEIHELAGRFLPRNITHNKAG